MGTIIRAASATAPQAVHTSDIRLAAEAAQDCLTQAGLAPQAVGVLVNVGVYRENNAIEPAMAALVQKEVGISLDYTLDRAPGLSFDLMNGACGILNAVQVAQALLGSGSTERVLVTAADVHPGGNTRLDPDYPYADLGAALLLERCADGASGFGPVRAYSARGAVKPTGYVSLAGATGQERGQITVRHEEGWAERLLDLAADSVAGYVQEQGLAPDRTLLVCNRPAPGFPEELARRLGLDAAAVVAPDVPDPEGGEPHTAAPVLSYLQAVRDGLPDGYDELLFVAAGAGPTVTCVRYRPQDR
ncbi:hypothetical protein ACIOHE_13945 [Streptomyces sp. NPDC087851]|uniref:hypothetical protein n=1 Tax=Streptomyces sp. NPDC087851 TaxID=3365810 RepID=UPI0038065F58